MGLDEEKKEQHKKAFRSVLIRLVIGLILVGGIALLRGIPEGALSDQVMAVGDAFTIGAFLYLGIGALLWVSTTDFFDIFGFALKRAAHAFIPGMVKDPTGNFYEYKEERKMKRKPGAVKATLLVGAVFLIISIVLVLWWYALAE